MRLLFEDYKKKTRYNLVTYTIQTTTISWPSSLENSRHFTKPPLGSASDWLRKISLTARPIRSATQIWVVTRHQYGISALVSQTPFGRETSGGVAKCQLFSQATRLWNFKHLFRFKQNLLMIYRNCAQWFWNKHLLRTLTRIRNDKNLTNAAAFDGINEVYLFLWLKGFGLNWE